MDTAIEPFEHVHLPLCTINDHFHHTLHLQYCITPLRSKTHKAAIRLRAVPALEAESFPALRERKESPTDTVTYEK